MNFHKEGNFREYLNKQSKFIEFSSCIKFMKDVTNGLIYSHDTVIHRDLKPENLLFNEEGDLMITDFGLAKLVDSKTRSKSFKGSGTLPYMAPECWVLDTNSISMDIYSLGILFYEILTLEQPFKGTNEAEYKGLHLFEPIGKVTDIRPDLPVRINDLISKMTSKRSQNRYHSLKEVLNILNDFEIFKPHDSNLDSIILKVNNKLSILERKELEEKKLKEEREKNLLFFDYSKKEFFKEVINRVQEINSNLERSQISFKQNSNELFISFFNKSFRVFFFDPEDIKRTINKGKEEFKQFQKEKFGYFGGNQAPTYIEKENIILIGAATIISNYYPNKPWGFNLVLKKSNAEDLYGEWWVVWFDDNPIFRHDEIGIHYPLGLPTFYQEYEYGRSGAMHVRNMTITEFNTNCIDELVSKIIE